MSVNIIIHHDPEGINKRDCIATQNNTCLLDFLIDEYGENGFTVPTAIFKGDMTPENLIDQGCFDELNMILKDGDIINILHRPQGVVEIVVAIIAVVAAVLLVPDIAPPPTAENPNFPKTNESPNNRLTGQTNVARPLARIPDIYGRMRVYPDLGTSTVTEYINHIKHVTEYLIIGRGEYSLEDLKSGETLITAIQSATSTIYNPGDLIAELLNINDSNEVNGQEVKAPNSGDGFATTAKDITFSATASTMTTTGDPDFGLSGFSALPVGEEFTITSSTSNDGTYTLASYASVFIPAEPGFDEREIVVVTVEETLVAEVQPNYVSFGAVGIGDVVGPFNVPGETEEIWIDIICPRGLSDRRGGSTANATVKFDFIVDELTSAGNIIATETYPITIQDNTLDARFYTFKFIPTNPGGDYQATLKRTSNTIDDSAYYDQTKWARLGGVGKLIDFDQGNVTSIILTTIATEQATKSQQRKFNAIVTRKLRTYTTAGGVIIPTLTATTRFADAMLEHLTNEFIGNKATTEIDLDGLYTIQEALDADPIYGAVLGRFSYSFSAEKASVKDELLLIANAVRVYVRKLGNTLEFGRDQIRTVRTTLFNTRTKKTGSEKKTRRLQKVNGFDGVELQWVEESTGTAFTVNFPDPITAVNPKRIEAAGIRNFNQAWNRAKIEYLKLKLQRETLQFDSTKEGLLTPVGDRVANADGTDVKTQSGEVKSISGFDVETYTPIDFDGNPNAIVILRDESGAPSAEITVTPRLDGIDGFILGVLPGFIIRVKGDLGYQVGTLYTFALTGEQKIKDYIIQSISPKNNGFVTLKLTNYDPLVFGPDTEVPPAPPEDTDPNEPGSVTIVLDPLPSGTDIPIHNVFIEVALAETLAWNLAPTGTYSAASADGITNQTIIMDEAGNWDITGVGTTFDTDSGVYRPGATGNDPDNYEIRVTASTSGSGIVNPLGGIVLNTWKQLVGGEGIRVIDNTLAVTASIITIEIREIATPANTTGIATFTFNCDGNGFI